MARCRGSAAYFIAHYVSILNATDETWLRFGLWPAQRAVLGRMHGSQRLIILKARQLGLTWLCLAYALWRLLFKPISTVGIFSRTETDASELLDKRLKGIYERLPAWMKAHSVVEDNKSSWYLSSGSSAMAFATTGGRQYTFSLVLVDEADYQPDLDGLLNAVKPTTDAGGRLWLISSANKDYPQSRFKNIYRSAKAGSWEWDKPIFLPWQARPGRTQEWYERQRAQCYAETGGYDDVNGEYPATDVEALSPRELDKRIPLHWLSNVYTEQAPLTSEQMAAAKVPSLPNLVVYRLPDVGRMYALGGDPAEGNPNSDPSALCVLDVESGEEMATLVGRIEPTTLASYAGELALFYNTAGILFERNNHGHTCLAWLEEHSQCKVLCGRDGRPGWLSSQLGKTWMYTWLSGAARDGQILLHSMESYVQLASIEAGSLSAPKGQHDDRADSVALANAGRAGASIIEEEPPDRRTFSIEY